MEQLLTIGEFATRSGLSRSALRFYDQTGLLRPQLVDADSGYRYYGLRQLDEAALVRRLRSAEVPVGVLRRYLVAATEERLAILDDHLASFRTRAVAVEMMINELRRDLAADDTLGTRSCLIAAVPFAEALQQVRFAIGDPSVRADLGAVWVETKEDSLRLVTTDSYRLAVRDLVPVEIGADPLRGVIDARHVDDLAVDLASAETLVLAQDEAGDISAAVDGRLATVGCSGESFPDYERILTELPQGEQIALPREAVVRALADLPRAPHLTLDFHPGTLVLRAQDRSVTVAGDTCSDRALRMFVNGRFFAEAVNAMVGPDLVVEASDAVQPITIRSADTGTFSVLTMPIRPSDAE